MISIRRYAQGGFTLIEILVAIAIIAIIAVTLGPYAINEYRKAQVKTARAKLRELQSTIEVFQLDVGQLPERLKNLVQKPSEDAIAKNWGGPYIKGVKDTPKDPWGRQYQYEVTSDGEHSYELYSYGPKGRGASQSEWISVWNL